MHVSLCFSTEIGFGAVNKNIALNTNESASDRDADHGIYTIGKVKGNAKLCFMLNLRGVPANAPCSANREPDTTSTVYILAK
jgi:hypothetical protein